MIEVVRGWETSAPPRGRIAAEVVMAITPSVLRSCQALLGIALIGPLLPGAWASPPPASPAAGVRDAQLTMQARRVLAQDELLARLNLGVSVRKGVATLWGVVPSAEEARRAVERLRQVQGLIEVRSELHVNSAAEPPPPKLAPPPLLPLEPRWPAALTVRPGEAGLAPGQTLKVPRPPGGVPGSSAGADPRPARPLAEAVALLPPVAHLGSPLEGRADGSPRLAWAVEQVRQGDPRFRLVQCQVQDRVVHVDGPAARWEDVLDLAQAVSRLSGVERVLLHGVPSGPRLNMVPAARR